MPPKALSLHRRHMVKGETTRELRGVGAGCHAPRQEPQRCLEAPETGAGTSQQTGSHYRLRHGVGSPKPLQGPARLGLTQPTLAPSAHVCLLFPGISDEVPAANVLGQSESPHPSLWSFPLPLSSPPSSLGESSERALNHQPTVSSSRGAPLCAHGRHLPARRFSYLGGALPSHPRTQVFGFSLRSAWLKSAPLDFGQYFLDL